MTELFYKLKRCFGLLKVYWNTCDGDWSSIGLVLQYQISRVRRHILEHNVLLFTDRYVRQMLIAETLLERLLEEPYYEIAEKRYPERTRYWAEMIYLLKKQDIEMLSTILRKHLLEWWD